jgi:Sec-independent protein translocase protein TatA
MFGISFFESLVIILLALVFFKPYQIITFFANLFGFLEKIKQEAENIKNDIFAHELEETKNHEYKDYIEGEFEDKDKDKDSI